MAALIDHPVVLFVILFVVFVAAVALGAHGLRRIASLPGDDREGFNIVQAATLTLLALLAGFSFSMAVGRYDQRKSLEEGEANAISTEYVRADLTDPATSTKMKAGLVRYTELRLADFRTRDRTERERIGRDTAALQLELRQFATQVAKEQPTPIGALVVAGMNDVLSSQDYSEAARIDNIRLVAWFLMVLIALVGCVVQGYRRGVLITILPATVALSLTLIADIDSPRDGIIRVQPHDLARLLQSLTK